MEQSKANQVGITLAYAGIFVLRAVDQHRTNRWQLSRPDEQNDIITPTLWEVIVG